MDDNAAFSQEVLDYILKNEHLDSFALALKKSPFEKMPMSEIAQQIQGRKVAKKKFPFLLSVDQFRYPKKESLEQASSEITASYKSKLLDGESFVDLTGGMGIDTFLLGRKFKFASYIEPNTELYKSTIQNFKYLGFNHCESFNTTCEDFLSTNVQKFDWAYIDPSRRIGGSRKTSVFNYEPNIVELRHKISDIAQNVLIKLSPMQDVSECINVLKNVHKIWVLSIQNEVKELLVHLKVNSDHLPEISALEINNGVEQEFTFPFEERNCHVETGIVKQYLYQPGSGIVKSELQNRYALNLGLEKLHKNTQLYTSDILIEHFIGRVFLVKESISLNKKELKKALPQMTANVITKNFPLTPQELLHKYKIRSGGEKYLIGYTDYQERKKVSICNRIS